MRTAFANALADLAGRHPDVLLLTGDLGFMVWEPFASLFPERFFNMGVAEQNMVGVATGLADSGFVPFVYSIATFATLRPYEFIRNGPIFQRLPVRIVGMGGGFDYGPAGPSHHALEDIGVLRVQPGITILAPADSSQATTILQKTWDLPGPVYYRLCKNDSTVPGLEGRFELGRVQVVRKGDDLLLVTMGSIATEACAAADLLAAVGLSATVAIVASLRPEPVEDLSRLVRRFPLVLSIEEHSVVGGVGSLIAEVMAERGVSGRLLRCGVKKHPEGATGSTAFYRARHGLSAGEIARAALEALPVTRR